MVEVGTNTGGQAHWIGDASFTSNRIRSDCIRSDGSDSNLHADPEYVQAEGTICLAAVPWIVSTIVNGRECGSAIAVQWSIATVH